MQWTAKERIFSTQKGETLIFKKYQTLVIANLLLTPPLILNPISKTLKLFVKSPQDD